VPITMVSTEGRELSLTPPPLSPGDIKLASQLFPLLYTHNLGLLFPPPRGEAGQDMCPITAEIRTHFGRVSFSRRRRCAVYSFTGEGHVFLFPTGGRFSFPRRVEAGFPFPVGGGIRGASSHFPIDIRTVEIFL
jgi:hypothetical protein